MIRNIPELPDTFSLVGYHSGKIKAYSDAYGAAYDFCRLYEYDGGYALIFNSNMVISGDDSGELRDFITMITPHTVEASVGMQLEGYREENVVQFTGSFENTGIQCRTEICADDIREIFTRSFTDTDFVTFYTDLSHRIRHGVSQAFMYNGSFAVCDFTARGIKYLSCLCTLPENRRNGDMKRLLSCISCGNEISVTAGADTAGIYPAMGFSKREMHKLYIMTC